MNRTELLSQLSCAPILMEKPFGLSFIASMAALPERMDWTDGEQIDNSRCYPVVNGVAIIPIIGTLVHRPSWSYYRSALPNYLSIADMIEDAVTDGNIKAVLLEVDSHGGLAAGCLDLAESIRSMRGIKPLWASINQSACSAAYALTSSVERVHIAKSAKAGSIGVMAVHWDYSAALEKWGEKVTYFYAGEHKIDGAPFAPLTEQAKQAFMQSIEAEYTRLCEVTAAGRGVDVQKMMKTEAAVYRGHEAVDAGLADQVSTFEETLMAIQQKTAPSGARLNSVSNPGAGDDGDEDMKTQQPAKIAEEIAAETASAPTQPVLADASAIAEACQTAGYPELTASLIKAKPTMETVSARIAEAKDIAEAAKAVGLASMTGSLVASGVNVETARKLLFEAKAGADGNLSTDPAHTQGHAPAKTAAKLDHRDIFARMNAGKTVAK
jgi:signal peptide peptidase SppA